MIESYNDEQLIAQVTLSILAKKGHATPMDILNELRTGSYMKVDGRNDAIEFITNICSNQILNTNPVTIDNLYKWRVSEGD